MKYSLAIIIVLVTTSILSSQENQIRLNQIGYYPNSEKRAVVVNTDAADFEIRNHLNESVYRGKLVDRGTWDKSGEEVKMADFTEVKEAGTYKLYVEGIGESYSFEITDKLYTDVLDAAVKSYYYQRFSMPIEEKYAGKWNRPAGFPDDTCYFHPSSGKAQGYMNSSKGWIDAGDYNKYIVNSGFTVGMLLNTFEMMPDMFKDNALNIPESGNGISDLLDEIKYNLDWMLTMQDNDGGAFVKLTSKKFSPFYMPHEDDTERFIVGKSTAASLNLAAATAMAARIYNRLDPEYSVKCLNSAERAWEWAVKNPEVYYKNPPDVVTGQYGDVDLREEFLWAASELYVTTNKDEYYNYVINNIDGAKFSVGENWRKFIENIAYKSLTSEASGLDDEMKLKIEESIINLADELLIKNEAAPYRIDLDEFHWASNSDVADIAIIYCYAHSYSGDNKYLNAAVECMDYIFGRNAVGYSFVSGYGTLYPMNIHHRPSAADGIEEPIPGFLIGGPNQFRQDDISKADYGVEYPDKLPAKCYVDKTGSYASNEIAINWTAPLIFVLGYFRVSNAIKTILIMLGTTVLTNI